MFPRCSRGVPAEFPRCSRLLAWHSRLVPDSFPTRSRGMHVRVCYELHCVVTSVCIGKRRGRAARSAFTLRALSYPNISHSIVLLPPLSSAAAQHTEGDRVTPPATAAQRCLALPLSVPTQRNPLERLAFRPSVGGRSALFVLSQQRKAKAMGCRARLISRGREALWPTGRKVGRTVVWLKVGLACLPRCARNGNGRVPLKTRACATLRSAPLAISSLW